MVLVHNSCLSGSPYGNTDKSQFHDLRLQKAMMQGKIEEERGNVPVTTNAEDAQENRSNVCKMCYSAAPAAILLPCRHFSCKVFLLAFLTPKRFFHKIIES